MTAFPWNIDPTLDLVLKRTVDVPPCTVWEAWTKPEHLVKWFTPAPWKTTLCEIDLRPGGAFRTVMESPEGQQHDSTGCYLEIVENERLVWTSALETGFRPVKEEAAQPFLFTAAVLLAPSGSGTEYTAIAMHRNEADCKTHDEMGFQDGWGTALNQLVDVMKSL